MQSWGQSYENRMQTAIDAGTYSEPFVYTDTQNLDDFTCDFICSDIAYRSMANDIFYKITLTQPMDIEISMTASISKSCTFGYLLYSSGEMFYYDYCTGRVLTYGLLPGTYYIVAKPYVIDEDLPRSEDLSIRIVGKARKTGDDFYHPFDLGVLDKSFSVSDTIPDINKYQVDYNILNDHYENYYRHDVVYQFTLSQPMELVMDYCGSHYSSKYDTYYTVLLDAAKDSIIPDEVKKNCTEQKKYKLEKGTYYIYVRTYIVYAFEITRCVLNLKGSEYAPGSRFSRSIDVGNRSDSFTYTDTQNTEYLSNNQFSGKNGNEVFYQLTLTNPMELIVDNCGSEVVDTYLRIFSADEQLLYYNDNTEDTGACTNNQHARIHVPVLLSGVYYIVTDAERNGNVTTTVSGRFLGLSGDTQEFAVDAGRHEAGFSYSDTKDTSSGYGNSFSGRNTDRKSVV